MRLSECYELHTHGEPDFPIIFHLNWLLRKDRFLMHWHENIELLYFCEGSSRVICDTVSVEAEPGSLAVVNSGALHLIEALSPACEYYCLIIDEDFCNEFSLPIAETALCNITHDAEATGHFDNIIREMEHKSPYYKPAVKAESIALLARLFRITAESGTAPVPSRSRRLEMVRRAISYLRRHYTEELTVDDICRYIGFSKYYFCRAFREITGKTAVDYLNHLRCDHARRLIASGQCNVSESAEQSGFHNLSYFSKTYKRQFGVLPSHVRPEQGR